MRYLKYLKGAAACTAIAGGLALFCFCASAEEAGLSAEEFAKICEENHAYESRYFLPPFKDPQAEAEVLNYAYHYREVVMLPDGSFADNPYDMCQTNRRRFLLFSTCPRTMIGSAMGIRRWM